MNKSMLASKNLPKPITKASDSQHWIRVLAAELALRLNDARQCNPTLWPKTIVLHIRQGTYLHLSSISVFSLEFTGWETRRSKQATFPFTREVTVDVIAMAGDKLWKELIIPGELLKVTNVSMALTGLETADSGQKSIEGFLKTGLGSKRPREDDDRLSPRRPTTEFITENPCVENTENTGNITQVQNLATPISFTCGRCSKRISLPENFSNNNVEENTRMEALAVIRMEHNDFHFAQDLSRAPHDTGSSDSPVRAAKKKRQKEPQGIAKFFNQK